MPKSFLDEAGNYYETRVDVEGLDGHTAVEKRPDEFHTWSGNAWVETIARPGPPTAAELDAIAVEVSEQLLEQDLQMKALALVMADLVERAFNVSQAAARQQVKTRFRDYYRGLLDT